MHPNIQRNIISNNQDMEAISIHPYEQIENMCNIYIYIHTHTMKYYLIIKRIKSHHMRQHRKPGGYYTQQSKSDRERQILYVFTYIWILKCKTNRTETDSQIQGINYWLLEGKEVSVGVKQVKRIKRYKNYVYFSILTK